jgi:hypothetical protein
LKVIESFDGSAGELLDWYRSKRAERVSLTREQQAYVSNAFQAKFNQLEATEEPMSE